MGQFIDSGFRGNLGNFLRFVKDVRKSGKEFGFEHELGFILVCYPFNQVRGLCTLFFELLSYLSEV